MSSLEADLFADLCADPALAALIGTRVYHGPLVQGATLPAVTYQRISTAPDYSHDGGSGLAQVRIQCNCWASTAVGAIALAAALRAVVEGRTLLGVCFVENELDDYEPDTCHWRRIVDLMIWHREEA